MTHIAVLSSNFEMAWQWLISNYCSGSSYRAWEGDKNYKWIKTIDNSLTTPQITTYVIVLKPQDVVGIIFDSYMISPFYETLEDVVKKRIRA